jgi:hypothetical protein
MKTSPPTEGRVVEPTARSAWKLSPSKMALEEVRRRARRRCWGMGQTEMEMGLLKVDESLEFRALWLS